MRFLSHLSFLCGFGTAPLICCAVNMFINFGHVPHGFVATVNARYSIVSCYLFVILKGNARSPQLENPGNGLNRHLVMLFTCGIMDADDLDFSMETEAFMVKFLYWLTVRFQLRE